MHRYISIAVGTAFLVAFVASIFAIASCSLMIGIDMANKLLDYLGV